MIDDISPLPVLEIKEDGNIKVTNKEDISDKVHSAIAERARRGSYEPVRKQRDSLSSFNYNNCATIFIMGGLLVNTVYQVGKFVATEVPDIAYDIYAYLSSMT